MTAATVERPTNPEALYEVVNGEVVELPPMSAYSNLVATEIYDAIKPYLKKHPHGRVVMEALFIVDFEATVKRRPDVAFISAETFPLDQPLELEGDWPFSPDLAVEVQSPSDYAKDIMARTNEYFRRGVKEVWVVYPAAKEVSVYRQAGRGVILGEGDNLTTNLIPGLEIPVADIFPPVRS